MAENSTGFSPSRVVHKVEVTDIAKHEAKGGAQPEVVQRKPLPTMPVTLKLHNVDAGVALRTLASVANQNIMLSPNVKGGVSINVVKVPWNQVFMGILESNGLDYSWNGNLLQVMTLEDMKREIERATLEGQRQALKLQTKRVEPLMTTVVAIRYAEADKLKENLEGFLTPDDQGKPYGSIVVDTHTNSLIIQAIADDQDKIIRLIDNLDKPRSQILLKANIVEASKDAARDLGIQWGGIFRTPSWGDGNHLWTTPGGTSSSTTDPVSGGYTPAIGTPGLSGQGFGVNFPVDTSTARGLGSLGLMYGTIGGSIIELQLNALQDEGKVNILSSPSISTLDNQMAFTENGERVPYVSTNAEGDREVKFEDAVLRLEITPHLIEDGNLKLKVLVKKDEVDLTRTVDGNPFIIKKQTETTLIVKDGETVVISGLTRERSTERNQGVPGLKDVEGLGWLFKNDSRFNQLEDVLIFITPHVLPYRDQAAAAQPQ